MKGIKIAAFILCIALASSVLGSMGWYATTDASINPGLSEETERVNDEVSSPDASGSGGDEFSLARGPVSTLNTLRILTTQAGPALERMGIHPAIAGAVGTVIGFTMVILLVQVIRGIRFG